MKPPKRDVKDFEKVKTNELVPGIIEDVAYDQLHKFKGFEGKPDTEEPAVRLKFKLEGCKFPHYTRWMRFNYGEKANLFKRVLLPLVDGAKPDMDFDIDQLKGMKIKTLWIDNGDYQNLETMIPLVKKLVPSSVPLDKEPPAESHEVDEEQVPF